MNKFLRALFILVILAMTGAIIFQLFFPTYGEVIQDTGISVGWQRRLVFGMWQFWSSSLPLISSTIGFI